MSSMPCSYTGMRLKPAARATSRASFTVARASTATMSGRGTMTSRTTVSPNSMIEWMRRRSSRSMTSPSVATSTVASSSDSDTKGPSLRPLPGTRTLARPMSARDRRRTSGNPAMAWTTGATRSAARSGCCTA